MYIGSKGKVASIAIKTGEIIWETTINNTIFNSTSGEVSVVEKDAFIFAGCNGKLYCLDKESGTILWTNELKGWGYGNISIAIEGVSVQYQAKIVHQNS